MQAEDDLRGLAKVMEFMRAVSILFVVVHIYWYCFGAIQTLGADIEVVGRILVNFDRQTGLFGSPLVTKAFAVVFMALSCLGTRGVKSEKVTWRQIAIAAGVGAALFFLPPVGHPAICVCTLTAGYLSLLMAGLWAQRMLRHRLMDDPFNSKNESFMQETRLITNDFSVNLPTRFYYKKRWHGGWINIVNPFRASLVLGTPGSGKSYAVVNNYIRQTLEKGFAVYLYDFKFDDLSVISTANIVKNLLDSGLIERSGRALIPTERGLALYESVRHLRIADVELTATWEKSLAAIESGEMQAETFMTAIEIYTRQITAEILALDARRPSTEMPKCPKCGGGPVTLHHRLARCGGCGFIVRRRFLNVTLTDDQLSALLKDSATPVIEGFHGKADKIFAASLTFDKNFNLTFVPSEHKK